MLASDPMRRPWTITCSSSLTKRLPSALAYATSVAMSTATSDTGVEGAGASFGAGGGSPWLMENNVRRPTPPPASTDLAAPRATAPRRDARAGRGRGSTGREWHGADRE
jgi:hypothetical protein